MTYTPAQVYPRVIPVLLGDRYRVHVIPALVGRLRELEETKSGLSVVSDWRDQAGQTEDDN